MVDIRDLIEYESPHNLAELFERSGTIQDSGHCSICGRSSDELPAAKLSLIKFRQAGTSKGSSRLYCDTHLKVWRDKIPVPIKRAVRPASIDDSDAPICPTCFVVLPLTGGCNNCW